MDGVFIDAARGRGTEAIEHRQFAMIQIRQPKHSATVIRLDSLFAHSDGLPCRSLWDYQGPAGRCNLGRSSSWSEGVLSAMACYQQVSRPTFGEKSASHTRQGVPR